MGNYNFCTLFDSYYLAKGLALYYSLKEKCSDFHLFIFAFDTKAYIYLSSLNLENATIISLTQFEDKELLSIKQNRTKAEYCWTSTSSTIIYCLKNFEIESCTYLDADLFFFNSPSILFEEIGNSSIAFTKHNYHHFYDQSKTNGTYCVQFMFFRNNAIAIEALEWWRNSCIDWCFNYLENGKFGDQGYLQELINIFKDVYIINNEGAGIAPWNLLKYKELSKHKYLIKQSGEVIDLVFFHFHYLKYLIKLETIIAYPGKAFFPAQVINNIYVPYIKTLYSCEIAILNQRLPASINSVVRIKHSYFIQKLLVLLKVSLKRNIIIRNLFLEKKA